MHCTNCNNEVPDTAMVCGYCGHRLKEAAPPPNVQARSGVPGWTWLLIGSMVAFVGILFFVIYSQFLQPKTLPPSPEFQLPEVSVLPTEKLSAPILIPSETPTKLPPTPTPTNSYSRCDLFDNLILSFHWLEFEEGSTLGKFYAKFPNGVPGLGKTVQGDLRDWEYRFNIGGNYTTRCMVYKEYPDRLYCEYPFEKTFSNTFQVLKMYVNGCDNFVYQNQRVALPILPLTASNNNSSQGGNDTENNGENNGGGGTVACSSGLDPVSCSASGGSYHYSFCSFPPCPEWCNCP